MDVRSLVAVWPEDAPRGAVTAFCGQYRVSQSWFYEVRGRVRAEGAGAALLPRSTAPRTSPAAIVSDLADLAVKIRRELADDGADCGPISVRHRMLQMGLAAPSRASLARIFAARGEVIPQPQKRPRSSYRRFCFALVHECWQLDGTEWALSDGTVVVIMQLLDDHSRYLFGSVADHGETVTAAIAIMRDAVAAHRPPQLLLSDNGTALNPSRRGWTGRLGTWLAGFGVRQICSRPYHPQTCGKNERIHQTLQKWLSARPLAATLDELNDQLAAFDRWYNHHRPHQALNMRTPADVLATDRHADTPTPPDPVPASRHQTPPRLQVTRIKVGDNGSARVKNYAIHLGREHAARQVLVVVAPGPVPGTHHLDIADPGGTLIRSLNTTAGTRYYGNGRPPGGRLRPRHQPTPPSGRS
ncbi:MAG: integrase core domain-containing protein [Stackebrandtia sp.]